MEEEQLNSKLVITIYNKDIVEFFNTHPNINIETSLQMLVNIYKQLDINDNNVGKLILDKLNNIETSILNSSKNEPQNIIVEEYTTKHNLENNNDGLVTTSELMLINREYTKLVKTKHQLAELYRKQYKESMELIEKFEMNELQRNLSNVFNDVAKVNYTCEICKVFNCTTERGLTTHKNKCGKVGGVFTTNTTTSSSNNSIVIEESCVSVSTNSTMVCNKSKQDSTTKNKTNNSKNKTITIEKIS